MKPLLIIIVAFIGCAFFLFAEEGKPKAKPLPPKAAVITTPHPLEKTLVELEQTCAKLTSFTGNMFLVKEVLTTDEVTENNGKIWYQSNKSKVEMRMHLSTFRTFDIEEAIEDRNKFVPYDEDYTFDGAWITNRNGLNKSLKKWEIEKSGNPKEQFKLGHGQFALPFNITKKHLLTHFKVVKKTGKNDSATIHLHLTPLAKSQYAKSYRELHLWLRASDKLPIKFSYEDKDAKITTATWSNVKVNETIPGSTFVLKPAGPDWTVETIPLKD
jgi:outer membrane lipoprotein-sorting protein